MMFENNGHIHVSSGAGADNPLGLDIFQKQKSFGTSFSPLNDFCKFSMSSQGHPIYTEQKKLRKLCLSGYNKASKIF